MSYFPMYTDISNKKCIIFGGGKVAFRKVKVLLDFGADVMVIAPEIDDMIAEISGVICVYDDFKAEQLDEINPYLVIAATSDKHINLKISQECKNRKIPVNVVDCPAECTFIFPSYLKSGEVVAAFSSGGQSPVITQYLKKETKEFLTDDVGVLAEKMAGLREQVKAVLNTESVKKELYDEILYSYLESGHFPTEEEFEQLLLKYQEKEKHAD